MIVALDMQLALGTATGIGEYAHGLANALRQTGLSVIELDEPQLDPWRFDRRVAWDQFLLPRRARKSGAGLLHCTSGTMPAVSRMPIVVTVHDVAWLKVQSHARAYARWYFGRFALRQYARARAIVVDSHFSRSELLGVLHVPAERVHVVYPGVAEDFCDLRRSRGAGQTIFVPGTVERRKNLEVLVRALSLLPDARIVSAGPFTPYRDECERLASELGVRDRLEFRGYVPRAELLQLYSEASLVAVPSRYEGFGYAAAQALCAGVPAIVSGESSLPEIAAGALPCVASEDERAWARAITEILSDPEGAGARAAAARAHAIERFAWSASASRMVEIYRSALGQYTGEPGAPGGTLPSSGANTKRSG